MVYFYSSTNKSDKLVSPISIFTKGGERKAFALAVFNFCKHNFKGSPKRIEL